MGFSPQIPLDRFSGVRLPTFSSPQYRFPFSLHFKILPQNWKVEPRNLCSTLSLTSCSFPSLAPLSPSFPSFLNFGVSYVFVFIFSQTLNDIPAIFFLWQAAQML